MIQASPNDNPEPSSRTLRGVCEGPDDEHFCNLDTPCLHECSEGCHEPEATPRQPPGPDDVHYLNDGCDAPHGHGVPPFDHSTD